LSQNNSHILLTILKSSYDVSSCLVDCSNQGQCQFDQQALKFFCECDQNYMGSSCQTDTRPCFNNKCLNNATCVNTLNMTMESYRCECPSNGLFYGQYCENRINTCQNVTCSLHGYCISNQNLTTQCKCLYGYSGEICDLEATSMKMRKYFQWTATIICMAFFVIFWMIVISFDVLSYFGIGRRQIDLDEKDGKEIQKNEKRIYFKYKS